MMGTSPDQWVLSWGQRRKACAVSPVRGVTSSCVFPWLGRSAVSMFRWLPEFASLRSNARELRPLHERTEPLLYFSHRITHIPPRSETSLPKDMSIIISLLTVIMVFVSLLIVLLVLMQRPKQEGLGAAFGGGMTDQMFGAQTSNVLQRGTVWLAIAFFRYFFASLRTHFTAEQKR